MRRSTPRDVMYRARSTCVRARSARVRSSSLSVSVNSEMASSDAGQGQRQTWISSEAVMVVSPFKTRVRELCLTRYEWANRHYAPNGANRFVQPTVSPRRKFSSAQSQQWTLFFASFLSQTFFHRVRQHADMRLSDPGPMVAGNFVRDHGLGERPPAHRRIFEAVAGPIGQRSRAKNREFAFVFLRRKSGVGVAMRPEHAFGNHFVGAARLVGMRVRFSEKEMDALVDVAQTFGDVFFLTLPRRKQDRFEMNPQALPKWHTHWKIWAKRVEHADDADGVILRAKLPRRFKRHRAAQRVAEQVHRSAAGDG